MSDGDPAYGCDPVDRELRALIDQTTAQLRFDELCGADREAVWLAYFCGIDYQAIARIQDEQPADTLARLTRALNVLLGHGTDG